MKIIDKPLAHQPESITISNNQKLLYIIQLAFVQCQQQVKKELEQQVERLSSREFQVLVFLAEGLTNREIAQLLGCEPSTVKTYVERIAAKFTAKNRTAIVATAFRLGILV
ncbi:MAG: LuxR C-terminal-related transcriptional regulator [Jaaginema sp. PMC 1079.18]|nr:LuxR C-terminal-related transcriptional regulator [Jaaginema sp. PMC 1080.18]MEC4851477.1 LuxR C-terminal-related transcriptional regulator [Jaaginema sp. PMC 1079.18]MEC4867828.1 LuxR C-terminal-related transcriptional regulator [Jaaginema sp. PMC 1078.18]